MAFSFDGAVDEKFSNIFSRLDSIMDEDQPPVPKADESALLGTDPRFDAMDDMVAKFEAPPVEPISGPYDEFTSAFSQASRTYERGDIGQEALAGKPLADEVWDRLDKIDETESEYGRGLAADKDEAYVGTDSMARTAGNVIGMGWENAKDGGFAGAAAGAAIGLAAPIPGGAAGGAALGFMAGNFKAMWDSEEGNKYLDMKKEGIPDDIARPAAKWYGFRQALIEEMGFVATVAFTGPMMLAGAVGAPTVEKTLAKFTAGGIKRFLTDVSTKMLKSHVGEATTKIAAYASKVGGEKLLIPGSILAAGPAAATSESFEEYLQSFNEDLSMRFAKEATNEARGTDYELVDWPAMFQHAQDAFTATFGGMAGLGMLGAAGGHLMRRMMTAEDTGVDHRAPNTAAAAAAMDAMPDSEIAQVDAEREEIRKKADQTPAVPVVEDDAPTETPNAEAPPTEKPKRKRAPRKGRKKAIDAAIGIKETPQEVIQQVYRNGEELGAELGVEAQANAKQDAVAVSRAGESQDSVAEVRPTEAAESQDEKDPEGTAPPIMVGVDRDGVKQEWRQMGVPRDPGIRGAFWHRLTRMMVSETATGEAARDETGKPIVQNRLREEGHRVFVFKDKQTGQLKFGFAKDEVAVDSAADENNKRPDLVGFDEDGSEVTINAKNVRWLDDEDTALVYDHLESYAAFRLEEERRVGREAVQRAHQDFLNEIEKKDLENTRLAETSDVTLIAGVAETQESPQATERLRRLWKIASNHGKNPIFDRLIPVNYHKMSPQQRENYIHNRILSQLPGMKGIGETSGRMVIFVPRDTEIANNKRENALGLSMLQRDLVRVLGKDWEVRIEGLDHTNWLRQAKEKLKGKRSVDPASQKRLAALNDDINNLIAALYNRGPSAWDEAMAESVPGQAEAVIPGTRSVLDGIDRAIAQILKFNRVLLDDKLGAHAKDSFGRVNGVLKMTLRLTPADLQRIMSDEHLRSVVRIGAQTKNSTEVFLHDGHLDNLARKLVMIRLFIATNAVVYHAALRGMAQPEKEKQAKGVEYKYYSEPTQGVDQSVEIAPDDIHPDTAQPVRNEAELVARDIADTQKAVGGELDEETLAGIHTAYTPEAPLDLRQVLQSLEEMQRQALAEFDDQAEFFKWDEEAQMNVLRERENLTQSEAEAIAEAQVGPNYTRNHASYSAPVQALREVATKAGLLPWISEDPKGKTVVVHLQFVPVELENAIRAKLAISADVSSVSKETSDPTRRIGTLVTSAYEGHPAGEMQGLVVDAEIVAQHYVFRRDGHNVFITYNKAALYGKGLKHPEALMSDRLTDAIKETFGTDRRAIEKQQRSVLAEWRRSREEDAQKFGIKVRLDERKITFSAKLSRNAAVVIAGRLRQLKYGAKRVHFDTATGISHFEIEAVGMDQEVSAVRRLMLAVDEGIEYERLIAADPRKDEAVERASNRLAHVTYALARAKDKLSAEAKRNGELDKSKARVLFWETTRAALFSRAKYFDDERDGAGRKVKIGYIENIHSKFAMASGRIDVNTFGATEEFARAEADLADGGVTLDKKNFESPFQFSVIETEDWMVIPNRLSAMAATMLSNLIRSDENGYFIDREEDVGERTTPSQQVAMAPLNSRAKAVRKTILKDVQEFFTGLNSHEGKKELARRRLEFLGYAIPKRFSYETADGKIIKEEEERHAPAQAVLADGEGKVYMVDAAIYRGWMSESDGSNVFVGPPIARPSTLNGASQRSMLVMMKPGTMQVAGIFRPTNLLTLDLEGMTKTDYYGAMTAVEDAEITQKPPKVPKSKNDQDPNKPPFTTNKEGKVPVYWGRKLNSILSNLYPREFVYDGIPYYSIEHAYQTLKNGYDEEVYKAYKKGKGGKAASKKALFPEKRLKLIASIMREAYKQDSEGAKVLLATGDKEFTHPAPDDAFWAENFPKVLSWVRDQLRNAPKAKDAKDIPYRPTIAGAAMTHLMPADQLSEAMREKYPKGTSTAQLMKDGLRWGTTRTENGFRTQADRDANLPGKPPKIGDVIEFAEVPGAYWKVLNIEDIGNFGDEDIKKWMEREGWSRNHFVRLRRNSPDAKSYTLKRLSDVEVEDHRQQQLEERGPVAPAGTGVVDKEWRAALAAREEAQKEVEKWDTVIAKIDRELAATPPLSQRAKSVMDTLRSLTENLAQLREEEASLQARLNPTRTVEDSKTGALVVVPIKLPKSDLKWWEDTQRMLDHLSEVSTWRQAAEDRIARGRKLLEQETAPRKEKLEGKRAWAVKKREAALSDVQDIQQRIDAMQGKNNEQSAQSKANEEESDPMGAGLGQTRENRTDWTSNAKPETRGHDASSRSIWNKTHERLRQTMSDIFSGRMFAASGTEAQSTRMIRGERFIDAETNWTAINKCARLFLVPGTKLSGPNRLWWSELPSFKDPRPVKLKHTGRYRRLYAGGGNIMIWNSQAFGAWVHELGHHLYFGYKIDGLRLIYPKAGGDLDREARITDTLDHIADTESERYKDILRDLENAASTYGAGVDENGNPVGADLSKLTDRQVYQEGFAQFMVAYILDPDGCSQAFKHATKWFDEIVANDKGAKGRLPLSRAFEETRMIIRRQQASTFKEARAAAMNQAWYYARKDFWARQINNAVVAWRETKEFQRMAGLYGAGEAIKIKTENLRYELYRQIADSDYIVDLVAQKAERSMGHKLAPSIDPRRLRAAARHSDGFAQRMLAEGFTSRVPTKWKDGEPVEWKETQHRGLYQILDPLLGNNVDLEDFDLFIKDLRIMEDVFSGRFGTDRWWTARVSPSEMVNIEGHLKEYGFEPGTRTGTLEEGGSFNFDGLSPEKAARAKLFLQIAKELSDYNLGCLARMAEQGITGWGSYRKIAAHHSFYSPLMVYLDNSVGGYLSQSSLGHGSAIYSATFANYSVDTESSILSMKRNVVAMERCIAATKVNVALANLSIEAGMGEFISALSYQELMMSPNSQAQAVWNQVVEAHNNHGTPIDPTFTAAMINVFLSSPSAEQVLQAGTAKADGDRIIAVPRRLLSKDLQKLANAWPALAEPADFDGSLKDVAFFRVSPDLHDIMSNSSYSMYHQGDLAALNDREATYMMERFARNVGSWLRWGATTSLRFMKTNLQMDAMAAMIMSESDLRFLPDLKQLIRGNVVGSHFVDAWIQVYNLGPKYRQFQQYGGGMAWMAAGDYDVLKQLEWEHRNPTLAAKVKSLWSWSVFSNAGAILQWMSRMAEESTRVAEFLAAEEQMLKNGASVEDALTEAGFRAARITVDFRRGGTLTKKINAYEPFFNPAIQGKVRILEVMDDLFGVEKTADGWKFKNADSARRKRAMKLYFQMCFFPAMVLYFFNHDDDEYKERPAWEKAKYFHIPIHARIPAAQWMQADTAAGSIARRWIPGAPDQYVSFLTIPKARDLHAPTDMFFGFLDWLRNDDPAEHARVMQQMFGTVSTEMKSQLLQMTPQIVQPLLEVAVDKNFFKDTPIEGQWKKQKLPSERATPFSSRSSVFIAEMLERYGGPPLSAPMIDHLVKGYLAGMGTQITEALDATVVPLLEKAFGTRGTASERQFGRTFPMLGELWDDMVRGDTTIGSQAMVNFYQQYDRYVSASSAWRRAEGSATRQAQLIEMFPDILTTRGPSTPLAKRMKWGKTKIDDTLELVNKTYASDKFTPRQKQLRGEFLYNRAGLFASMAVSGKRPSAERMDRLKEKQDRMQKLGR